MEIIAAIPSYGRPERLKNLLGSKILADSVDDIFVLSQDKPLGSGRARKILCEKIVAEYPKCLILMLDDDCTIGSYSNIREVANLFKEHKNLGIVQLSGGNSQVSNDTVFRPIVFHCFMINSELINNGINYSDHEQYFDEVDLSIKSYLAGYKNATTFRGIIRHDVNSGTDDSGIYKAIKDGNYKPETKIFENYGKYISNKSGVHYAFKELPNPDTIILNNLARTEHERNISLVTCLQSC